MKMLGEALVFIAAIAGVYMGFVFLAASNDTLWQSWVR
jgi:hypothetical protein